MRVLIATDKFKGSLTATEASAAMAAGWRAGWPQRGRQTLEIQVVPVADGGEGTSEAIHQALNGTWVTLVVSDPLGRPVEASYTLVEHGGQRFAAMEMSSASGFLLVRDADRDLLRANTFGTGQMLRHAFTESNVEHVVIGIGGSATNDGGIGLAAALGYRLYDAAGNALDPIPAELPRLARIDSRSQQALGRVIVACDVVNPLLGARGATRIFAPQKGMRGADEAHTLEAGLTRLADVAAATFGRDYRDVPGAGAAGGLGFGLVTFCGAELRSGFDLVADLVGLPAAVQRADIVVTGEGALDHQTLAGKAPAGVSALARRAGKPVIAFAGRADPSAREALAAIFRRIRRAHGPRAGPVQARMHRARRGIASRARRPNGRTPRGAVSTGLSSHVFQLLTPDGSAI